MASALKSRSPKNYPHAHAVIRSHPAATCQMTHAYDLQRTLSHAHAASWARLLSVSPLTHTSAFHTRKYSILDWHAIEAKTPSDLPTHLFVGIKHRFEAKTPSDLPTHLFCRNQASFLM
eukprot:6202296-Pleurochrysis_carterae.AAC.1